MAGLDDVRDATPASSAVVLSVGAPTCSGGSTADDCRTCADHQQLLKSGTDDASQKLTNSVTCRWHDACLYA
jgi:hypothetical protein